ncbi:MAG: sulfatase [Sandaracinaceae bacterium]|nr:sulfatase [Sandaracinaceae bacterium]
MRWSEQLLDLSRFAGEVVRVELSVDGDAAEVGFAEPAIVVPMPPALAAARADSAIVVLVDTLRATKLRTYEPRSRVQTPALDAFAEQAAVFEHAQSPENWTKPSVASILTSLTPATHNTKEDRSALPDSALMVSEVFQQAGFATASFIANGYVSDRFGFGQGWDHYTNYIRENRRTEAENVFDEALEWIEAHRDERFFAYVHTIDPHVPYDPPDDLLRLYDPDEYSGPISPRRTGLQLGDVKLGRLTLTARDIRRLEALHDGEITYHDRHFARFVERLRELGLYDRIVFVVTADHGEEFNEHGSFGHGHSVYQELLHVPLMVRWHGVIEPRRVAPTVSTLDVSPTILEATGVPIPEVFEGQSLLSTARGVLRPGPAVAFSDKLDDRRVATAAGYKLIVRGNLTWSFFHLRDDPGERAQIDDPGRHPIALRYLRGLMGQHLGAADRGDWLHAGTGTSRALPAADSVIDRQLCEQLRAIGYHDSRCDGLL